jgi:hypothetical protein
MRETRASDAARCAEGGHAVPDERVNISTALFTPA